MSVSGTFTLHFSFGCSGTYGTTTLTFNNDGTFSTGSGNSGRWSQTNGNALWRYNGDSAIYAGVVNGGAIVGNMVNFAANNAGCFYASKDTASAAAMAVDHDDSGLKSKKK